MHETSRILHAKNQRTKEIIQKPLWLLDFTRGAGGGGRTRRTGIKNQRIQRFLI
nr:MAG TPA: hypothetical protein [Caudoviricetes sp.]